MSVVTVVISLCADLDAILSNQKPDDKPVTRYDWNSRLHLLQSSIHARKIDK